MGGWSSTSSCRRSFSATSTVYSEGASDPLKDLPPKSTMHNYLELWNWDGMLEGIHHALYVAVREQEGRDVKQVRRSKSLIPRREG